VKIKCIEPEGEVQHSVWPFKFTKKDTLRLYEEASKFPVLFGRPLKNLEDFTSFFLCQNLSDDVEPQGLIWIVDEFRGMFYLNNIRDIEADVHYSFFDRRHKGRAPLVRKMLTEVFDKYGFVRLNAYIPAYAGMGVRKFVESCGFRLEGRKRKNSWWKGEWFDTYLYGILREDLKDGSTTA
jgi:RimJ/RimL family protein N-acetyltransferase